MAATNSHRYLGGADRLIAAEIHDRFEFELDEADVWAAAAAEDAGRAEPGTNPRLHRKPARKATGADHRQRSLPVNVPNWQKILGVAYRPRATDWEDDGDDKIPPHEYLARNRAASLSVHEGAGRTLKGRDLSRVRNAIWKQTGFED